MDGKLRAVCALTEIRLGRYVYHVSALYVCMHVDALEILFLLPPINDGCVGGCLLPPTSSI